MFDLTVPTDTHVRAVVLDALGREVALLHEGSVTSVLTLSVDAGRLAVGMYVLRASITGKTASARFTVSR